MIRLILPLLLLGACASAQERDVAEAPPAESQAAGTCDAAKVQDLVGKPAAAIEAEARRRSGARTARVYESGSPVTMDFSPDRLNIEHDPAGRVVKLSCG